MPKGEMLPPEAAEKEAAKLKEMVEKGEVKTYEEAEKILEQNPKYIMALKERDPELIEEYEPGKFRPNREGWKELNKLRGQFEKEAEAFTSELEKAYSEGKNPLPELRKKWKHGEVGFAYSPDRPGTYFSPHASGELIEIPTGLDKNEVAIISDSSGNLAVVLGSERVEEEEEYEREEEREEEPTKFCVTEIIGRYSSKNAYEVKTFGSMEEAEEFLAENKERLLKKASFPEDTDFVVEEYTNTFDEVAKKYR